MLAPRRKETFPIRLSRSLIVGALASTVDLVLLFLLVQVFYVSPQAANMPSLIVGSATQFLGNRHWAFHAQRGSLRNQFLGFVASEALSFGLNSLGFYLLVRWTHIYYPLARMFTCLVVFMGFSYPTWAMIFRTTPAPKEGTEGKEPKSIGNLNPLTSKEL